MNQIWKRIDSARLAFWFAIAFTMFLLGGVFALKEWQPYQLFVDGYKAVVTLIKEQHQTRSSILWKRRYGGNGVTRYDPDKAYQGLTLMQGVFTEGIELRLVDMTGQVINRWPVDFFQIWPNPTHVIPEKNIPINHFHYHTQGMWLLPDGSVVVNVGMLGTVKMNKCGEVQWTVDRMTHHSITPNPDGSFWIPVKGDVREISNELLLPRITQKKLMDSSGWYEDRLMRVGPNGTIEKEISVLKALFDGGFERELLCVVRSSKSLDPTHINDIEVVGSALAQKIDGIQAGDLLVSIKRMDMLAILDKETGQIKWHHTGPWIRQHDPDITVHGTIEVFNNGHKTFSLGRLPGSNLISLDPTTGQSRIIYPLNNQQGFHTDLMGTHQRLSNGNRLITESMAGRVFEVDRQGNIVWEYIKPYDDSYASLIEAAIRYDQSYFVVRDWNCS